jgi:hypothetical protein
MNMQAKKKGGMMFGGKAKPFGKGKMRFAKGGITYKDPDISDSSAEARKMGDEAIKDTADKTSGSSFNLPKARLGSSMAGEFKKASNAAISGGGKKQSFREAFAEHKNDKSGKFTWNGKEYNTAMAGSSKPAAPAASSGKKTAGGGKYDTSGITPSEFKRVGTTSSGQAIRQTVMPQPTAADTKAKHDANVASEKARMDKNKAAMAAPAKAPAKYTSKERSADFARMRNLEGNLDSQRSTRARVDKPHDFLGSLAARQFLMSPEQEEQVKGERTFLRNKYNMSTSDSGMKRGGKVMKYAKGGSIDGIAQRGKTNCKTR